ncbi:TonB-dependent receptor [Prolixibacteraceae bacterium JC049]|nr:TonB-dependent receptor [Prolixibacteraceae bacterium JC049]
MNNNIFCKNIYLRLFLAGFLLIISSLTFAQKDYVLRGVVTDKVTDEPLPGATVAIKNANGRFITGVATDLDGRYTLNVNIENAILNVSFIGYKDQVIKLSGQKIVNVALGTGDQKIDEVVITATVDKANDGYMQIDRKELASAITKVELKDVAVSSATSVEEMMQGRATGVQLTAASGDPGSGYTIRIRGAASINASNDPLIVVDGMRFEARGRISSISDITSQTNSPLADINPESIESLEVLKDAAATAIYGAKGANGVIIITTKKGRRNSTTLTYSSSLSTQYAPTNVPLLSGDDMKILILEGTQNGSSQFSNLDNPSYPQLRDDPTRNDYHYYNNNTDWLGAIQKVGFTYNNSLSLRGGGNTTRYSFTLGSANQTGTIETKAYDRLTTDFNLDYNISDKLTLKTAVGYTRSKTNMGGDISGFDGHGTISAKGMAMRYPSFLPIYNKDSNGNDLPGFYVPNTRENIIYPHNLYNPVGWLQNAKSESFKNRFRSNLQVMYDIIKGVRLVSKISVDFTDNDEEAFVSSEATNRDWNNGLVNYARISNSNSQNITQENILSVTKRIGTDHKITFSGVTRLSWYEGSNLNIKTSNSGSSNLQGAGATNRWTRPSSGTGVDASNALTGQLHYVFLNRYIFQGTINREGSSRFGAGNRFGVFPAASFAWRLSNEPFIAKMKFINDCRIRASWGKSGNTPTDKYLYFNKYSANVRYLDQVGVKPDNIQLDMLKWETSTTKNIGLNISMFKNRFNAEFEIYEKYTKDLLMKRNLPGSAGFGNYWTNFGDVRNRGLELAFDGRIIDSDVKWNVNFNISFNRNKIMYIPDDNGLSIEYVHGYPLQAREGDAIGTYYGYVFEGIYANDDDAVAKDAQGQVIVDLDGKPKKVIHADRYEYQGGDAIYKDLNNDGIINEQDFTKIGDSTPDYWGGFGSKLSWKGFTLNAFFQYQVGNDVINQARRDTEAMSGGENKNANQAASVLRRWRKQGDVTDMPRVVFGKHHNSEASDRYLEDGSYMRLKQLALTYNLPSKILSRFQIQNASLTFNAYNVWTLTNYSGQDPEISINTNKPIAKGFDTSRTAVPKSFTVGLRITFK